MPDLPRRHALRLPAYDYRRAGAYFVTICSWQRLPLFGHIEEGVMHRSPAGQLAADIWTHLAEQYSHLTLDAWVIMPNHMHGILFLDEDNPRPLGQLVGSFKASSTRAIRTCLQPTDPIWQRNFYEHVIRDERDLDRVRSYIANNPAQWELDEENPEMMIERSR